MSIATRTPKLRRWISPLERLIAIAVVAACAGVVLLRPHGSTDRARTQRLLGTVSSLRAAAAAHYADTGVLPAEDPGGSARDRQLSQEQHYPGWSGPYLERPLTPAANPFGGSILLYSLATVQHSQGFDIDGDATIDVTRHACTLWLSRVPLAPARAVDRALDAELPGVWSESGRVRYSPGAEQLWILVYH